MLSTHSEANSKRSSFSGYGLSESLKDSIYVELSGCDAMYDLYIIQREKLEKTTNLLESEWIKSNSFQGMYLAEKAKREKSDQVSNELNTLYLDQSKETDRQIARKKFWRKVGIPMTIIAVAEGVVIYSLVVTK